MSSFYANSVQIEFARKLRIRQYHPVAVPVEQIRFVVMFR